MFCSNKEADIYFECHGSGEPLCLIAGYSLDSQSWGNQIEYFAKEYQVIVIDNSGSGRTAVGNLNNLTIKSLADDVKAVLDHLQIQSSHVVGHSMGGYIAQDLTLSYPEVVNKLILASTASTITQKIYALSCNNLSIRKLNIPLNLQVMNSFAWTLSDKAFENPECIKQRVQMAEDYPYIATIEGQEAQLRAMQNYNTLHRLKDIKQETLVLTGEDDILIPAQQSRLLLENIEHSHWQCILNGAHNIQIEYPNEFNQIVSEFLKC